VYRRNVAETAEQLTRPLNEHAHIGRTDANE
jgi:hypothetical protein